MRIRAHNDAYKRRTCGKVRERRARKSIIETAVFSFNAQCRRSAESESSSNEPVSRALVVSARPVDHRRPLRIERSNFDGSGAQDHEPSGWLVFFRLDSGTARLARGWNSLRYRNRAKCGHCANRRRHTAAVAAKVVSCAFHSIEPSPGAF